MTKKELNIVTRELKEGINYPDTDLTPLWGCALPEFSLFQFISKEVIVMHLRWQCIMMNGNIDEKELNECLQILKDKKVIMV